MSLAATSANSLNPRELALLIWILVTVIYAVTRPNLRSSLLSVIKILLSQKIVTVIALSACYCILEIVSLSYLNIWSSDNSKTTAFWFISYACLSIFQINNIEKKPTFFREAARNSFTILAVFQFITNLHTFNLAVEFLILPLLFILTAITVLSQHKSGLSAASTIANNLLASVGFLMLAYSTYKSIAEYETALTISKVSDFIVPCFLTIGFLPFLYLLHIYSSYESCFTSIQFLIKDQELLPYARRSAIRAFKFKTKFLKRWQNQLGVVWPQNEKEVDKTIATVLRAEKIVETKRQPFIPKGWHPSKATKFLEHHGLKQDFYHPIQDATWTASSQYRTLDEKPLANNIAYYIFGDETTVYQLQISLNVNDIEDIERSIEEFTKSCKLLYWKSTKSKMPESLSNKIRSRENFQHNADSVEVHIKTETWSHGAREGLTLKLILRSKGAPDGFDAY